MLSLRSEAVIEKEDKENIFLIAFLLRRSLFKNVSEKK